MVPGISRRRAPLDVLAIQASLLLLCCRSVSCGNMHWNYQAPHGARAPLQVGQFWREECLSETDIGCSGPFRPVIHRHDPDYLQMSHITSAFITTPPNQPMLVMPHLEDAVTLLALWVHNEWGDWGVKLRIDKAYVADCNPNTYDALHCEGRAVHLSLENTFEDERYATMAWMATKAGFDYVIRQTKYSVHASVKYQPPVGNRDSQAACFPGGSTVTQSDGTKIPISRLNINDRILTYDQSTGGNVETAVVAWLHYDHNVTVHYLRIHHSFGQLELSPDHLVFTNQMSTIFAGQLLPGDQLLYFDQTRSKLVNTSVMSVEAFQEFGAFAPLTDQGTITVDGIHSSCFASVRSQLIGYFSTLPMRFLPSFLYDGVHVYALALQTIAETFMPCLII